MAIRTMPPVRLLGNAALSFLTKIVITQLLVLPLGVALGALMPIGIAHVGRVTPAFVPWAWGVNGFASVVGSCLAVLISTSRGFTSTFRLAAVCYGAAALLALIGFKVKRDETVSAAAN